MIKYIVNSCLNVLQKSGFNETWCGWMKTLVIGGTLSVTINNSFGN
jgi:hypothetical protein